MNFKFDLVILLRLLGWCAPRICLSPRPLALRLETWAAASCFYVDPSACTTHSLPTEPSLLKILLPWQAETSCGSGQLGVMGIWIPSLKAWISALTLSNTFAVLMDLLYILGILQAPSCPHKKIFVSYQFRQPTANCVRAAGNPSLQWQLRKQRPCDIPTQSPRVDGLMAKRWHPLSMSAFISIEICRISLPMGQTAVILILN